MHLTDYVTLVILIVAGVFAIVGAWKAGQEAEDENDERVAQSGLIVRVSTDLQNLRREAEISQTLNAKQRAGDVQVRAPGPQQNPQVGARLVAEQNSSPSPSARRSGEQQPIPSAQWIGHDAGRAQASSTPYFHDEISASGQGGRRVTQQPAEHQYRSEQLPYQPAAFQHQLDPAAALPAAWSAAYRSAPTDMVRVYLDSSVTRWDEAVQVGELNILALRTQGGQWYLMHKLGTKLDENFGSELFDIAASGAYVAVVNRPAVVVCASASDFRGLRRDTIEDWKRKDNLKRGSVSCSDNPEPR